MIPLSFPKFAAGWLPALAVSASVDPAPRLADAFLLELGGIEVPLLTCGLGLLGIVTSRPMAIRRETGKAAGWPTFVLVSLVMLIIAELWIVEFRPGVLFAFVVSFGLGFSGYSLLEPIAAAVGDFIKRVIAVPTARLDPTSQEDKT